jgi:hypothetical protein
MVNEAWRQAQDDLAVLRAALRALQPEPPPPPVWSGATAPDGRQEGNWEQLLRLVAHGGARRRTPAPEDPPPKITSPPCRWSGPPPCHRSLPGPAVCATRYAPDGGYCAVAGLDGPAASPAAALGWSGQRAP